MLPCGQSSAQAINKRELLLEFERKIERKGGSVEGWRMVEWCIFGSTCSWRFILPENVCGLRRLPDLSLKALAFYRKLLRNLNS